MTPIPLLAARRAKAVSSCAPFVRFLNWIESIGRLQRSVFPPNASSLCSTPNNSPVRAGSTLLDQSLPSPPLTTVGESQHLTTILGLFNSVESCLRCGLVAFINWRVGPELEQRLCFASVQHPSESSRPGLLLPHQAVDHTISTLGASLAAPIRHDAVSPSQHRFDTTSVRPCSTPLATCRATSPRQSSSLT